MGSWNKVVASMLIFIVLIQDLSLSALAVFERKNVIQAKVETRLGQPDGISPSRMAEMLEVDKAGPKVRC
jgi:hypothetical protein